MVFIGTIILLLLAKFAVIPLELAVMVALGAMAAVIDQNANKIEKINNKNK